jgi:hypothetical protein
LAVNAANRVEVLRSGVNVVRKLKFARVWDDVLGALGMPVASPVAAGAAAGGTAAGVAVGTTAAPGPAGPIPSGWPGSAVDSTARTAAARSATVRAEGVRAAAIRAIRADYVFAAGYALLFVSVGVWLALSRWQGDFMHLVCAWCVGVAGILAAVLNVEGDHRVIHALEAVAPDDGTRALESTPYEYHVGKWIAILAAFAAFGMLWF